MTIRNYHVWFAYGIASAILWGLGYYVTAPVSPWW